MGVLEAPQDRHRQERRTGTSRAEQTDRDHGGAGNSGSHGGAGSSGDHGGAGSSGGHGGAGSSGGHGGAGSSGGHGGLSLGPLASTPSARPLQPEPYYPPPQTFPWGSEGGISSPLGLNRQDSTKHDRTALQGQTGQDRTEHDDRKALQGPTDKTGHPTGTRSPPGLARRLRLLLGMTRCQGPSQGPSATASTSATRGPGVPCVCFVVPTGTF